MTQMQNIGFLRPKTVAEIFGVSRATLYRWIQDGSFPSPLKDGRLSFWTKEDIHMLYEQKKDRLIALSSNNISG